eukprot:1083147-Heterocapsa_arctica.AAC.1
MSRLRIAAAWETQQLTTHTPTYRHIPFCLFLFLARECRAARPSVAVVRDEAHCRARLRRGAASDHRH